jgi:hypothetical protein
LMAPTDFFRDHDLKFGGKRSGRHGTCHRSSSRGGFNAFGPAHESVASTYRPSRCVRG